MSTPQKARESVEMYYVTAQQTHVERTVHVNNNDSNYNKKYSHNKKVKKCESTLYKN